MKKIVCIALALILVFGLCACGETAQKPVDEPDTGNEQNAGNGQNTGNEQSAGGGQEDKDAPETTDAPESGNEPETTSYVFLDENLGLESYAIGFRRGEQELADTVSGAIMALVLNGTYERIGEKYPDIRDYLSLTAEGIDPATLPEEKSGDPNYTFLHGFDLDYPPYSYLQDDGSVGGFDVEMAQAVCEYLGWGYEPVPFNWDFKDIELNAGSCDCIWSGFTKEGREDMYTWGVTYSSNKQMIMVASDSGIKTLSDLAGKTVGVQISTSAAELLEGDQADLAATFADLVIYDTYTIAYTDLKAGAIDALAIDVTAGSFLIANDT